MTLTNRDLSIKLQKAKYYLVAKLDGYLPYQELIEQIDSIERLLKSESQQSDFIEPKVIRPKNSRLLGRHNSQQLGSQILEGESLSKHLQNRIVAIIDRFFDQAIRLSNRKIKYHQEILLLNNDPESLRAIAKQLPQRYQRKVQEHFKICKQHINRNKIALTNPFIKNTLIAQI